MVEAVSTADPPKIILRYLDSPRDASTTPLLVLLSDVIKLADEQEKELPSDLLEAVEKQRAFVFKERAKKVKSDPLGEAVGMAKDETLQKILDILAEG